MCLVNLKSCWLHSHLSCGSIAVSLFPIHHHSLRNVGLPPNTLQQNLLSKWQHCLFLSCAGAFPPLASNTQSFQTSPESTSTVLLASMCLVPHTHLLFCISPCTPCTPFDHQTPLSTSLPTQLILVCPQSPTSMIPSKLEVRPRGSTPILSQCSLPPPLLPHHSCSFVFVLSGGRHLIYLRVLAPSTASGTW